MSKAPLCENRLEFSVEWRADRFSVTVEGEMPKKVRLMITARTIQVTLISIMVAVIATGVLPFEQVERLWQIVL